jgi:hypothetical protein
MKAVWLAGWTKVAIVPDEGERPAAAVATERVAVS